jgi:hypothetical protein
MVRTPWHCSRSSSAFKARVGVLRLLDEVTSVLDAVRHAENYTGR